MTLLQYSYVLLLVTATSRAVHVDDRSVGTGDTEIINQAAQKAEIQISSYEAQHDETWSFPVSMTATVKFGYDNSMQSQMETLGTDFETFINAVMAHVQTYYLVDSLTTEVNFEVGNLYIVYNMLR